MHNESHEGSKFIDVSRIPCTLNMNVNIQSNFFVSAF